MTVSKGCPARSTEASVRASKAEYRRLYAYVQTLPVEARWEYGAQIKALKAAAYVEIEGLRHGM